MVINVSKEFIFIPEFNGNKDEPAATQVRVRIRNPTVATKARIGSRPETVARADAKGAVDSIEIRMHDNDDAAIREMLVAIEGLEYEQDGGADRAAALRRAGRVRAAAPRDSRRVRPHTRRERGGRKKLLIAFRAYREGIHEARFAPGRDGVLWNTHVKDEAGNDVFIRRGDVPRYMTDYFWSCLRLWVLTENLGALPFGGGWADNPHEIVQVVNALRVASSQYDEEQRERRSAHDAEARKMTK